MGGPPGIDFIVAAAARPDGSPRDGSPRTPVLGSEAPKYPSGPPGHPTSGLVHAGSASQIARFPARRPALVCEVAAPQKPGRPHDHPHCRPFAHLRKLPKRSAGSHLGGKWRPRGGAAPPTYIWGGPRRARRALPPRPHVFGEGTEAPATTSPNTTPPSDLGSAEKAAAQKKRGSAALSAVRSAARSGRRGRLRSGRELISY